MNHEILGLWNDYTYERLCQGLNNSDLEVTLRSDIFEQYRLFFASSRYTFANQLDQDLNDLIYYTSACRITFKKGPASFTPPPTPSTTAGRILLPT